MVDAVAVFQAFAAGVFSFFAPCSIAMLPAYISYYLGRKGAEESLALQAGAPARSRGRVAAAVVVGVAGAALVLGGLWDVFLVGGGLSRLGPQQFGLVFVGTAVVLGAGLVASPGPAAKGARLGLVTSLGILAVFGLLGVPVFGLLRAANFEAETALVLGVAAGMVAMGALGLAGRELSVVLPVRAPRQRDNVSFLMFGVAYGIVAMGCNLPLFLLAALGPIVRDADAFTGFTALLAYGAGIALLMVALSVSLALSKGLTEQRLRSLVPRVKVAGNVVLISAGIYIAWYYWTVLRLTAAPA